MTTSVKIAKGSDCVTLLMGVRNGARFLTAQLDSIGNQSHKNWYLICADDGSTDRSMSVVTTFQKRFPYQVSQVAGPQNGFSANYLGMIAALPNHPGPVGLADQDDIWMPDKLARGLKALNDAADVPTLYCSRRWNWYPTRTRKIASPAPRRACTFRNALVENVAFGNTILLNPAAATLARDVARRIDQVFAHDWWLYLLITGAGGRVIFDTGPPTVLYRQHSENAIGAGTGASAGLRRKIGVLQGEYADRINSNLVALIQVSDLLTNSNRAVLHDFLSARGASVIPRLLALKKLGTYRQSWRGNLGLWGAAGFGQI